MTEKRTGNASVIYPCVCPGFSGVSWDLPLQQKDVQKLQIHSTCCLLLFPQQILRVTLSTSPALLPGPAYLWDGKNNIPPFPAFTSLQGFRGKAVRDP